MCAGAGTGGRRGKQRWRRAASSLPSGVGTGPAAGGTERVVDQGPWLVLVGLVWWGWGGSPRSRVRAAQTCGGVERWVAPQRGPPGPSEEPHDAHAEAGAGGWDPVPANAGPSARGPTSPSEEGARASTTAPAMAAGPQTKTPHGPRVGQRCPTAFAGAIPTTHRYVYIYIRRRSSCEVPHVALRTS